MTVHRVPAGVHEGLTALLRGVAVNAAFSAGKVIRASFGAAPHVEHTFPHDLKPRRRGGNPACNPHELSGARSAVGGNRVPAWPRAFRLDH